MVKYSESIIQVRQRGLAFSATPAFQALHATSQEQVMSALAAGSPVDTVVGVMEALWPVRADLDKAGGELLADAAQHVLAGQFHGKGERAEAILGNTLKDLGERKTAPDAPETAPGYGPPQEDEPAEPAPSE